MALTSKPMGSTLKIAVLKQVDGKSKTATRSYNRVKPDAEDAAIYNVGKALGDLQTHPVSSIVRTDNTELVNI